jgi:hypothetical protein
MTSSHKPLIALFALDDNVRLGILPHSNKFVEEGCTNNLTAAIEFNFKRGEILLMHPVLVHYGCAYNHEQQSLRAHFYFDNPEMTEQVGRQGQQTYLFKQKVQPMPKNQRIAKAQQTEKDAKQVAKEACKRTKQASKVQTDKRRGVVSTIRTRNQILALSIIE